MIEYYIKCKFYFELRFLPDSKKLLNVNQEGALLVEKRLMKEKQLRKQSASKELLHRNEENILELLTGKKVTIHIDSSYLEEGSFDSPHEIIETYKVVELEQMASDKIEEIGKDFFNLKDNFFFILKLIALFISVTIPLFIIFYFSLQKNTM